MKVKGKFTLILLALLFAASTAWGATALTTGDQTIYGNKTFEHDLIVKKDLTVEGATIGINRYSTIFYVHSGTGHDSTGNYGKTYLKPFATVDFAINNTTANKGDIVYVMPGHAETIAAANGFDADVAGIYIIGLGEGANKPTFTFSATASTVAVGAANVTFKNLRFLAGISAVVIGVAVEAAGDNFTCIDCEWPEPLTAAFEFLDAIDLASGADGVKLIRPVQFTADAVGAAHFMDAGNGANNNLQIIDPYLYGEYSVSAIWSDTIDLEVLIEGGSITNLTNGEHAIEFTTTALGSIKDVLVRTDAQGTAVDPGSMSMSNVLWDADATTDSTSFPVVLSTAGVGSIGSVNSTTTDSLHGKIGTDTEMADSSLYDLNVADQVDLDAILAASGASYNHANYLAVATGTFDTTGVWSTATSHEVATVTGCVRMLIIPEVVTTMSSVADTGTMTLGDETTGASIIAASTIGAGLMAAGELWVDATLTKTILTRIQLNAIEFAVCAGKDIGYTVATNALSAGSMIFHIYWTPMDATGAVAAGAGGTL